MTDNNYIGNITTIGKIIAMIIGGWAIGFCVSYGINLPVDQQTLSELIFAIFLLIWGILDAKFPNSLRWFGNAKNPTIESNEPVLNDEYEWLGDENDGC